MMPDITHKAPDETSRDAAARFLRTLIQEGLDSGTSTIRAEKNYWAAKRQQLGIDYVHRMAATIKNMTRLTP